MNKVSSIPQYFLRSLLRNAGLGLFLLFFISFCVSFLLARDKTAVDLKESASAMVEAYQDRIIDGDIRSVEPQIQKLLKIKTGESAQILKHDLSRVYDSFSDQERVKLCPEIGIACFDGYLGLAHVFVPISVSNENKNAELYLYVSKRVDLNWGYFLTIFAVFALGYLGLFISFLRISKATSIKLGTEIEGWANRLETNPKSTLPLVHPPFTELKPLKKAVEGLTGQIEKFEKKATDKAKLLLLRGIAHDLITPVARLQFNFSVLELGIDRTKNEIILDEINDSLKSVTSIASQVKALDELEVFSEETELIAIARQSVRAIATTDEISKKEIKLEFNSSIDEYRSSFSKTEISRVLSNLINNAVDASPSGSSIFVEVREEQGEVFLSVKDQGCGIPASLRDRVFEPDFTLKPGTGTGLGLPIVKYICGQHLAKIELESEVDVGTIITIRMKDRGIVHV